MLLVIFMLSGTCHINGDILKNKRFHGDAADIGLLKTMIYHIDGRVKELKEYVDSFIKGKGRNKFLFLVCTTVHLKAAKFIRCAIWIHIPPIHFAKRK